MKLKSTLLATALLFSASALAGHDHDTARLLREQGRIIPLEQLLKRVQDEHPGTLLEVELEHTSGDRYVYEVELLDSTGEVHKFHYDAKTGAPIKTTPED